MNRFWQLPLIVAVSFVLLGGGTGKWCVLAPGLDHALHAQGTCDSDEDRNEQPCSEDCAIELDEMILTAAVSVPAAPHGQVLAVPTFPKALFETRLSRLNGVMRLMNERSPSRGEPDKAYMPLAGQLRV